MIAATSTRASGLGPRRRAARVPATPLSTGWISPAADQADDGARRRARAPRSGGAARAAPAPRTGPRSPGLTRWSLDLEREVLALA